MVRSRLDSGCLLLLIVLLVRGLLSIESVQASHRDVLALREESEDVLISLFVGGELRNLILESGADESDGAVDEVTNDIVEFSVDLPFKFFPGEVRVLLFGPEANERVAPVFSVFKLKRFVYPDACLLALRESLSFELYVFCGGYFPRQIVSFVAGQ